MCCFGHYQTNRARIYSKCKSSQRHAVKGKGKEGPDFKEKLTYMEDGKRQVTQADALRKVYWRFQSKGRVVEIAAPRDGEKKKVIE